MTLRRRLLLVYLIVVFINVATVAAALFELDRSHQIIRELQGWNRIIAKLDKFLAEFAPEASGALGEAEAEDSESSDESDYFRELISRLYVELVLERKRHAPDYLDVEAVRQAITKVQVQYLKWRELDPKERLARVDMVQDPRVELAGVVQWELSKLNAEADMQDVRKRILLIVVVCLTILHVAVMGSLLRRWLLWPMEKLNRQVDALARDEPPADPLLTEPLEMANLAQALDRARRSLGALRQQLVESERLTTIGQFAAQLAHNLRNPLASIRAAAQVSGRHAPGDEYVRERMDEIVASVDRLNRWIAGLMEVARREPTATQAADVVLLLERVREALQQELATKELVLAIEAPEEGLVCPHDPETLEHALIAMIVNAIEASPVGGRIAVQAERVGADADRPAVCRISVLDYGAGLPADAPDRIFDFSYSTKQRGMGLGLALARQALQRQGGQAYARRNPEGGATVYVELPLESSQEGSGRESAVEPDRSREN